MRNLLDLSLKFHFWQSGGALCAHKFQTGQLKVTQVTPVILIAQIFKSSQHHNIFFHNFAHGFSTNLMAKELIHIRSITAY